MPNSCRIAHAGSAAIHAQPHAGSASGSHTRGTRLAQFPFDGHTATRRLLPVGRYAHSAKWSVVPAVFTAIVAGKVVYYAMKALVLAPAVLIETQWTIQLFAIMLWGSLFALFYKKD